LAVAAASDGEEVVFPTGTYLISESIIISKGITMRGLGRVKILGAFAGVFFDFDGNLSSTNLVGWQSGTESIRTPFRLFDIQFTYNSGFGTVAGSTAIRIRNSYYGVFRPAAIQGFGKAIDITGTNSKSCFYNTIYLGQVWHCKYGIYSLAVNGSHTRVTRIFGGHISSTTAYWDGDSPYPIYIDGSAATGSAAGFMFYVQELKCQQMMPISLCILKEQLPTFFQWHTLKVEKLTTIE